jgi:hypothetical protein
MNTSRLTFIACTFVIGCNQSAPRTYEPPVWTPGVAVENAALRVEVTRTTPVSGAPSNCGSGRVVCGDQCVQTQNDPRNCGGCGYVCPTVAFSVATCHHSTCIYENCIAGHADCDGDLLTGCETDTLNNSANCGACGRACGAGVLCVAGHCDPRGCPIGSGNCDGDPLNGCESNTDFDGANCGGCGQACPAGQACVEGACKLSACDLTTEVELAGACYYLDGSGGRCDVGYQLASQSVLSGGMFTGKTYKHQVSDNCCIYNADANEDWGMGDHCNLSGPFSSNDPLRGAFGCTGTLQLHANQLTLCYR